MQSTGPHDVAHHHRFRGTRALAMAVAVLGLAAVHVPIGLAAGSEAAAVTKTVNVKARDTGFTVAPKAAPVGAVKFVVTNIGKRPHDFKIAGKKTRTLATGKSTHLLVVFKTAGSFRYVSTVRGDVAAGLTGTLRLIAPPKPATSGDVKLGKSVFVANCGTCHTLEAAGTTGTIGPDLDGTSLAVATIVSTVTNGKTGSAGTMPPFGASLSSADIQNVAAFVYASTH